MKKNQRVNLALNKFLKTCGYDFFNEEITADEYEKKIKKIMFITLEEFEEQGIINIDSE